MKTVNKYGLEYAGPRRARRKALKQWLIDLFIGAAAMAVLWWLLSLVSRAATRGDVMPLGAQAGKPMLRTAGFGVPDAVAVGIVAVIAALVVWRLITGAREEREPTMEDADGWADKPVCSMGASCPQCGDTLVFPRGLEPYCENCGWPDENRAEADPLADGDTLKREQRASEAMPEGMTRRDAAEIARAAAAEIELCRRMVDGAARAMNVEDYGDALAGASKRLGQVRVTMRELAMTFDQGGIKA